jgi:predicted metal-binding membrane protein
VTSVSRLNLGFGGALLALAAVAWYLLVIQSPAMAMTMDITIPVYLAIWVTMLAAMMLPATAPLAVAYGRVAHWPQCRSVPATFCSGRRPASCL